MLTLLLALATPTTSVGEVQARSIDAHGVRATYTRTVAEDGTVHLRGVYKNDGSRFHFQVRGHQVTGTIDGGRYQFAVPKK